MFEYREYIYEVYRTRNISKAAENLFISQPALSTAIKKAEANLGFQIFNRSTTPITLTDYGKVYIESLQKIMEVEIGLQDSISAVSDLRSGSLKIGGSNFFTSCMLPIILKPFMAHYPNVDIEIVDSESNHLYNKDSLLDIDLILDAGAVDESQFTTYPLCTEHLLLGVPAHDPINDELEEYQLTYWDVVAKRYLDETPAPDLSLFQGKSFLLLNKNHDLYSRSMSVLNSADITPSKIIFLSQLMTAYNYAMQGIGITFLTDTMISLSKRQESLLYYKIDHPLANRTCFLAHASSHYKTKAMERFISDAQEWFQST